MTATDNAALTAPPKATDVETHGVEPIPDAERTAGPLDLFRLIFGGANTIATVVLGRFPIIFGLSFRDALIATLVGVVLGSVILAPMSLFGPRNGTNNAVSSSAHLGVHGRVVGSFLSLLTAVAFFSISVWTSGDVLVGGANRALGLPRRHRGRGRVRCLFALLVLVVCIYGFRFMLLVEQDRRRGGHTAVPGGHLRVRRHVRRELSGQPGCGRPHALAVVRRRRADRDVESGVLRRVPRRLGPLHPARHPGLEDDDRDCPGTVFDPGAVPVRIGHRHRDRHPRAEQLRERRLRRRPAPPSPPAGTSSRSA